jgi:hypothetical protein
MAGALAAASTQPQRNLAAVRAWWRVRHPPPSVGQRLDLLYMTAITVAVGGALGYGTASSALAQVLTPQWLAVFGPSLAMLSLLVTAHWGAYHGPVVFSPADVGHLLGAPLPRRGLVARRLVLALAGGAAAGTVAAGVTVIGLAGEGRSVGTGQAAGLTAGLAEVGVLAVAAAWAVERSLWWERAVRRATWPTALIAAALAAASDAGQTGRSIVLWSGPWGWAVQPATGAGLVEWLAAISVLTLITASAAAIALRHCGHCPTERHLRRAEGRTSATASLASFDARTARQALQAVGARPSRRPAADLGWLRNTIAARGARSTTRTLAIVWRDTVAAARAPGRVIEAAALAGAATVLCLFNAERPLAVAAATMLVYLGASRMLWPLRTELDTTSRTRVLLRPRIGRVLLAHSLLAMIVTTAAALLAVAGCAILGQLPVHGAAAALAAMAVPPTLTWCAAMSARRGGRLPQTVLVTAVAVDPSGGGLAILSWLTYWPMVAVLLGGIPIILITSVGAGAAPIAVAWTLIASVALIYLLSRDPVET